MSRRRIIEGRWSCSSCGTQKILGRHKTCTACGSPRESTDGETDYDFGGTTSTGGSTRETVTDADALALARSGEDWHCAACGSANRGDAEQCRSCGAAKGPTTQVAPPAVPGPHTSKKPHRWLKRFLALGIVVVAVIGLMVWATRTQEVEGVTARTWTHTVSQERFTPWTTGGWQNTLNDRAPVMPVEGTGEVAGVQNVRDCQEKQSGTRQVPDGTETVCHQVTHQVQDGTREDCQIQDLGNGFAEEVCTHVATYTTETTEECQEQTIYRQEPIYDTWCTYDTWTWKTIDQASHSGTWDAPTWPELETGRLDRTRQAHAYLVTIAYPWRGDTQHHEVEPASLDELQRWKQVGPCARGQLNEAISHHIIAPVSNNAPGLQ